MPICIVVHSEKVTALVRPRLRLQYTNTTIMKRWQQTVKHYYGKMKSQPLYGIFVVHADYFVLFIM